MDKITLIGLFICLDGLLVIILEDYVLEIVIVSKTFYQVKFIFEYHYTIVCLFIFIFCLACHGFSDFADLFEKAYYHLEIAVKGDDL